MENTPGQTINSDWLINKNTKPNITLELISKISTNGEVKATLLKTKRQGRQKKRFKL